MANLGNPAIGYPARMPYQSEPVVPKSLRETIRQNRNKVYPLFFVLALAFSGSTLLLVLIGLPGLYERGFEITKDSTYFSMSNPNFPQMPMRLYITRDAIIPTMNPLTSIRTSVSLVPGDTWYPFRPNETVLLSDQYYIIFAGSDCKEIQTNALNDGSCFISVGRDRNYTNSLTVLYPNDGNLMLFLSNPTSFNPWSIHPGTAQGQFIERFTNQQLQFQRTVTFAYIAVLTASFTMIALFVIEFKRRRSIRVGVS